MSEGNVMVVERVIARLEEAGVGDRTDALLLNDLAVAYLVRASTNHAASDLYLALEVLEAANDAPVVPEVVTFNRALVLDRMGLVNEAGTAWQRSLDAASNDGWALEARQRADTLGLTDRRDPRVSSTPIADVARRNSQEARELVLTRLLPDWGRALHTNDGVRADSLLDTARAVGALLATLVKDSSVALAVAQSAAMATQDPARLVTAIDAATQGAAAFERGDIAAAEPLLDSAVRSLVAGGASSLAAWSHALLGAIELTRGRYDRAERRLLRVAREAERRSSLSLAARAHWGVALSMARRGNVGASEREYETSSEGFRRAGERGNRGRVLTQLGQVQTRLGRDEAGMNAVLLGLHLLRSSSNLRARHDALIALGQQLAEAMLPRGAAVAFREALASAPRTGRPADHVEALLYYASAQRESQAASEARQALAEARRLLEQLPDSLMRQRLRADVDLAESRLMPASESEAAIANLNRAAAHFASMGNAFVRNETVVQRARLYLRQGDTLHARADLKAVASAMSSVGVVTGSADDRRRQIDLRRELFGELLALALVRNDTTEALETYATLVGG
ncbi:MAG: hypothetical protein ACT4P7_09400, partial [Gemmatimonadaceae bacterium]